MSCVNLREGCVLGNKGQDAGPKVAGQLRQFGPDKCVPYLVYMSDNACQSSVLLYGMLSERWKISGESTSEHLLGRSRIYRSSGNWSKQGTSPCTATQHQHVLLEQQFQGPSATQHVPVFRGIYSYAISTRETSIAKSCSTPTRSLP